MPSARRATPSKATAAATRPDAQVPELPSALVYTQDDFEEANSNLLYDPWRFRGSPLFGDPPPAETGDKVKTKHKPKAKGDSKAKGNTKMQGSAGPEPQSSLKQIPDFARIFVFSDDEERLQGTGLSSSRELAEFCELKVLNCNYAWWATEAQRMAEAEITQHLLQVYDAAMTGFAHNPKWKQVHAILIIGAFFTQVVWNTLPSDEVLRPLATAKIPGFEVRAAPQCLFVNAKVFEYHPNPEDPSYPRVSLSKEFLYALDRPISELYPQLTPRSTLFALPRIGKPRIPNGTNSKSQDQFKNALIDNPTAHAKEQVVALGYRFPEDEAKPATPTPPNSVAEGRFKGGVKNVKSLPKLHIMTRKRSLKDIPAMHRGARDDDSSEDEDSDSEDEGDE